MYSVVDSDLNAASGIKYSGLQKPKASPAVPMRVAEAQIVTFKNPNSRAERNRQTRIIQIQAATRPSAMQDLIRP
jgi:hypothetical protein